MRLLFLVLLLLLINTIYGQIHEDSIIIEEVFISVERLPGKLQSSIKSVETVPI